MQAPENMRSIVVTEDVSKLDKSPLNEEAPENMLFIIVTEDVLKLDKSRLNEEAL